MAYPIIKGAEWVLSAERAEGAPEAIYGVECLVCRAESGLVDNDPKPVGMGAIRHTQQLGLDHGQFLVTTQRHWRVDPVRLVPVRGEDRPPPSRTRTRAHARPSRVGRSRRVAAWAWRLAGPWVLVAVAAMGRAGRPRGVRGRCR